MRYPSGVLSAPLKNKEWKKYTKTVTKSGEGVSGGVYFFGSNRGSVKKVVVKPESMGKPEDKEKANGLLSSAGVPVPKGRIVAPDSPEGRDIMTVAARVGGFDLSIGGMGGLMPTQFLEVMSTATGSSLSTIATKAADGPNPQVIAENVHQMVLLLSSSNVQDQLASMMVRDAIGGNTDRIMKFGLANIGNVMIAKGNDNKALPRALHSRITAIDSETTSEVFQENQQRDYYQSLVELGKNPATYVERLMEAIGHYLDQGNPDAGAMFTGHPQYGALKDSLTIALRKASMREARIGLEKADAKASKDWQGELRSRRIALWNFLTG